MNEQFLRERKQILERQFYGASATQGVGGLCAELDARTTPDDLRGLLVLTDGVLIGRLVEFGVTGSVAAALTLVPVIEVAWADGKIQQAEKDAVLGGSGECGIAAPECEELLAHWLSTRPQPSLFAAWTEYVRTLGRVMSEGEIAQLQEEIVDLTRAVAKAAGGIMGFGRISGAEEKVLVQVAAAFER